MTQATAVPSATPAPRARPSFRPVCRPGLELDTRLLGMIVALAVIWVGFNILSGGLFMTPRNLWNLSVQSASVAIMATGMVLVIVSRNIDLSIGSVLGFTGMAMAMLQAEWIPKTFGLGFDQPWTWIVTLAFGLAIGAIIGGVHGFVIAYIGVPSFIVTLGGLLVWRGIAFQLAQGQTIAPLDSTFALLGGGPQGSLGENLSWLVAGLVVRCDHLRAHRRPPATAPQIRVPAPPDAGGDHARRASAASSRSAPWPWPTRTPGPQQLAQQLRGRERHHRAAGRPDHPDGHRHPGPHRARDRCPDDLPRHPAPVRPLRLRDRRQPGRGRTSRASTPGGRS